MVVGGAVGGFAVLAVGAVGFVLYRRCRAGSQERFGGKKAVRKSSSNNILIDKPSPLVRALSSQSLRPQTLDDVSAAAGALWTGEVATRAADATATADGGHEAYIDSAELGASVARSGELTSDADVATHGIELSDVKQWR
jgi:hypothetical protein